MTEARTVFVVIEARDLDTDAREEVTLPAIRPATEAARGRELRELIARVHPDARFRSFARDVASALGSQHLIVAHYVGEERTEEAPAAIERPVDQGELFAA